MALSVVKRREFVLTVDHDEPLDTLVARLGFDEVSPDITPANFPAWGQGRGEMTLVVVGLSEDSLSREVLCILNKELKCMSVPPHAFLTLASHQPELVVAGFPSPVHWVRRTR
jgi:hypothetical protein